MNERIRKIAIETDAWCDQHYTGDPMYDIKWEQKFSELIVRECINIVDNLPNGYKDYRNTIENEFREDCINTMKKHFGIEE
jgi:hypothetical protein